MKFFTCQSKNGNYILNEYEDGRLVSSFDRSKAGNEIRNNFLFVWEDPVVLEKPKAASDYKRIDLQKIFRIFFPEIPVRDTKFVSSKLNIDENRDFLFQVFSNILERINLLPSTVLSYIRSFLIHLAPNTLKHGKDYEHFFSFLAEAGYLFDDGEIPGSIINDILKNKKSIRLVKKKKPKPYKNISSKVIEKYYTDREKLPSMTGYEQRESQVEISREISKALNSPFFLVFEAGTGIGKSIAYLIPAIEFIKINPEASFVISTNTKNLQDQLFYKDLPELKKILGGEFSYSLLKGRNNYMCIRKFSEFIQTFKMNFFSGDELVEFSRLLVWAFFTEHGELESLHDIKSREMNYLKVDALRALSHDCIFRKCPYFNICFYERARALAARSNIVFVNHSLLLSSLNGTSSAFPSIDFVILDEAHNVQDVACDVLGADINYLSINRTLNDLHRTKKRGGFQKGLLARIKAKALKLKIKHSYALPVNELIKSIRELKSRLKSPFEELLQVILLNSEGKIVIADDSEHIYTIDMTINEIVNLLNSFVKKVENVIKVYKIKFPDDFTEEIGLLQNKKNLLEENIHNLTQCIRRNDPNLVCWIETLELSQGYLANIKIRPVYVGEIMNSLLFSKVRTAIFSSATITVNEDFTFFKHSVGLDLYEKNQGDLNEKIFDSPFRLDLQTDIVIPAYLPFQDSKTFVHQATGFIAQIADIFNGRTLALFTSYKMMRNCHNELKKLKKLKNLKEPKTVSNLNLLVQGKKFSRTRILEIFKRNPENIILGTSSFWEGIDLPGDILKALIIVKLPFPVPTEPLFAARCKRVEDQGLNPFLELSIPVAVLRLKQGIGRLIRKKDDTGIISILDKRIIFKRYGKSFLNSLPCKVKVLTEPESLYDIAQKFLKVKIKEI